MTEKARIVIQGEDRTRAAFTSAARNVEALKSKIDGLVLPFRSLGAVAATVAAAVGAVSFKETIDTADQLGKLSQRTGVAVEELSALRYAGELADLSVEDLGAGLKKLNQNIAAAARGEKEQAAAFQAIGVAVKNADGSIRSADEVLGDIAEKFEGYADGANKVALANALGGRSFEAWIPLLNGGRDGLKSARDELQKFGGVMSGELAKNAERFNDNITRLSFAAEALKVQLASGLVGRLVEVSEQFLSNARASGIARAAWEELLRVASGRATFEIVFGTKAEREAEAFRDEVVQAQKDVQRLQELLDKLDASGSDAGRAERIRNRLADAQARVQALTVGGGRGSINPALVNGKPDAGKPDAPPLPTSGNDAEAAARKLLDARIRALADSLSEQRDIEQFHAQFVKTLHDDGLVSLDAFYAHQQASRAQALQATRAALDEERRLLEVHRKTLAKPQDRADVDAKLEDVARRRATAEREAAQAADLAAQEKARTARALQDGVAALDAQLAALAGDGAPEALLDIARQVRAARELLTKAGADPAKAADLARLLELQRQFVVVRGDVERATEAAALAEERLLLAAEARGDGLLDTEREVYRLRQAALEQLDRLIERTQALAEATKDPEVLQYLEQLRLQRERAAAVVDPTKNRYDEAARDGARAIVDGLRQAVVEGGKLRDILDGIGKRLLSIVLDELALKPIEDQLRQLLKGWSGNLLSVGRAGVAAGAPAPLDFGGGQTIDRSVAGTVDAPSEARDALRALEAGAYDTTAALGVNADALGKMATETSTTSTVLSILPSAGATPATSALAALTAAAQAAAAALSTMAASGGGGMGGLGALLAGGGEFFSSWMPIAGAGEAGAAAAALLVLHDGGVVGRDLGAEPPSTFRRMDAGIAMASPLKMNERRAVLEVGEEVLTRDDPRHRDNLRRHPVARELLESFYHSGGIVGQDADRSPFVRAADAATRSAEPRSAQGDGERAGDTYVTHITVPAGTPRETANQIGNRIAERAAFARRRNG